MKIDVLLFARVREQLGTPRVETELAEGSSLQQLIEILVAEHGPLWREVLGVENVIRAVNQVVSDGDVILSDGDEVAFFPPVTGG